jgi:hypothetical protein
LSTAHEAPISLADAKETQISLDWSPDGKNLLFPEMSTGSGLQLAGPVKEMSLLQTIGHYRIKTKLGEA